MSHAPAFLAGAVVLAAAGRAAAQDNGDPFAGDTGRPRTDLELAGAAAVERAADVRLLLATVDTESGWNTAAVNDGPGDAARGGAWGLCQLTYRTACEVDDQNGRWWATNYPGRPANSLLIPWPNLRLAADLVRELQQRVEAAGFVPQSEQWAANVASLYNSGKLLDQAPASTRDAHVPRFLRNWRKYAGES